MDVPRVRSARQQISRHDFRTVRDVVGWMGAVQAQDPLGVRWAIGARLEPGAVTEADVARAIDDGEVVRMHAMRFTWQLIAAEDVRWILALLGPRLIARAKPYLDRLALDGKTILRANRALARAMRGGVHLVRAEIAKVLAGARISSEGGRLSLLLGLAELDGVLTSGACRGKHATWALLDERVPETNGASKPKTRDAALRELARRYLQSRAPATVADFAWWSGLALGEARSALDAAKGERADAKPVPEGGVHLLAPFDEYLVSYKDRSAVLDPKHVARVNAGGGLLAPTIVADGRVIGTWRRTLGRKNDVAVEHDFFVRPNAATRRAVAEATQRYARFLGR